MSFSKQAAERADNVLAAYRRQAEDLRIKRTDEIYAKIPEIKQIDDETTSLGGDMAKAAIKGGDDIESIIESTSKKLAELSELKKTLLKENGYAENYMTDVYRCSLCKDTGFKGGSLCSCRKKIMSEYDLASLNIDGSNRFENFNLDYYSDILDERYNRSPRSQMKDVLEYCKNYADTFSLSSDNVLMYGKVGLGKTFLCSCIALTLAEKGYSVVFQSAYNIFEIISKNKFKYKKDYSEDVQRLYDCDLLIMDDLGTEFLTEYTHTALFDIIERRLVAKKPTIINFNLSPKDVEARYSDRIMSRLLTFTHLLFLGNDIRAASL